MFKTVIAKTGLKKEFKTVNKGAFTQNKQPIVSGSQILASAMKINNLQYYLYVKMEEPNLLLLSEAVCKQLGVIHYYPSVKPLDVEKFETAK